MRNTPAAEITTMLQSLSRLPRYRLVELVPKPFAVESFPAEPEVEVAHELPPLTDPAAFGLAGVMAAK